MHDPIVSAELYQLGATWSYAVLSDGRPGEVDFSTRTIRVSPHLSPAETRCTILHEAGHLALGHGSGDEDEEETEADIWAAERLIPQNLLDWAQSIARDRRDLEMILHVDPDILDARLGGVQQQQSARIRSVRVV